MKQAFFVAIILAALIQSRAYSDVYNDNVVVVLDASGSMQHDMSGMVKMDAAKKAIGEVLKTVPETTQIGLLVFSGRNKPDDWVFPLGRRDDQALLAALRPIGANGNTPLGAYMKKGADRLLEEREKQLGYGTYRLLIVTDGEATDQDLVDTYTPGLLAKGIIMDVIGVAMQHDHVLANSAHSYRRADDAASLRKAIADVLGEVSASDDQHAGEEAFAIIAPLPEAMAMSMIHTLATSDNSPIQQLPGWVKPRRSDQGSPGPSSGSGSSGGSNFVIITLVLLVFGASVFRRVMKHRRSG